MAQLGNWFSRVFSNDGTRGLSGDASFIAGEQGRGGYFASRLRLHTTTQDLVEHPELLWELGGRGRRRGGLQHHVSTEQGDGVAGFTDLLVVVSQPDWNRSVAETGDYWQHEARETLLARLAQWCKVAKFNEVFPDRAFQLTVLADGSEPLRGHGIGLEPGQFVTALLPNCYRGPLDTSSPVLAVHLNIPGAWEGYRKVGMLYSDQLCYTLGNHWLDNFSHEALEAPALYQLQQYPDGSLVHVINPDYQQRFEVGSVQSAEGPSVLAVTERGGGPVAFLVLGVEAPFVREQTDEPLVPARAEPLPAAERKPKASRPAVPPAGANESAAASAASAERKRSPRGSSVTRIEAPGEATAAAAARSGSPAAKPSTKPASKAVVQLAGRSADDFDASQGPARPRSGISGQVKLRTSGNRWHHTIVPDAVEERIFTLKERGALLQRVHFSLFMEGYDVHVSRSGQLGTAIPDPRAIFRVREDKVYFVARGEQVLLAGRRLAPDQPVRLKGDIEIRVGNQLLDYRDLGSVAAEGWPYLGEIRRTAGSSYLVFGSVYRMGRDRRCKVRLPDEPHNENLVWRMDLGEGDFIRSRTGDIPKSRFYNDSIMVASLHAEIDVEGEPMLRNLARHCYSFVRRGSDAFSLFPARDEKGTRHIDLLPGDEILVGNNLFEVSYPPPRTPEVEKLTAETLARAAESLPDDSFIDEPPEEAESLVSSEGVAGAMPALVPSGAPPSRSRPQPAVAVEAAEGPAPRSAPAAAAPPASKPVPPLPPPPLAMAEDAPVAGGLGESGPAPDGIASSDPGFDSILGIEPPFPKHLLEPLPAVPKKSKKLSPVSGTSKVLPSVESSRPARRAAPPRPAHDEVVAVDEAGWQMALSRPGRLQQLGWMVSGRLVVGNHRAAQIVVPENRTHPQQSFEPRDYYEISVRGRRGNVAVKDPVDARLSVGGDAIQSTADLAGAVLEVVRRDEQGEEDFIVSATLRREAWLPDPRAQLLSLDLDDRLVAALFTRGFPLRGRASVRLGPIDCIVAYDHSKLVVSDYLDAYAYPDGTFQPFFWRSGSGRFRTVPEDGSVFELENGDMLIAGRSVYVFQDT